MRSYCDQVETARASRTEAQALVAKSGVETASGVETTSGEETTSGVRDVHTLSADGATESRCRTEKEERH